MRVNAIWLSGKIGPVEWLSICSYQAHGYEVALYSYDDDIGAPAGVCMCDAAEIYPEPILRYKQPSNHVGSPVLHVNVWRYLFMFQHGGYFTELDQICLGRMPHNYFVSSENASDETHPNLAVLHLPPHTRLMKRCLGDCLNLLDEARKGTVGPKLIKEHITTETVMAPNAFCPVKWSEVGKVFSSPSLKLPSESIGVQLWGAVLRRNQIDVQKAEAESLWSDLWGMYA